MTNFEDFIDSLDEATEQLFADINHAWQELKSDLHSTVTVKYLRLGGIAYCKRAGEKYYGILTGLNIISLNAAGELDYFTLPEFLELHGADKLKVAAQKRLAVGGQEIDYQARMAVGAEKFPSTEALVLHCLGTDDSTDIDEAIENRFGAFEWLTYDIPPESDAKETEE